jgi:hypothetical protein
LSCAICAVRKQKRFCPALHDRICPQCCGEQREVTLDCPSDCVYLRQARVHEGPRALENLPAESLFPAVEISRQFIYEHEQLLVGMNYALARSARADRSLHDQDIIAALGALAKTQDTLVNAGLHYPTQPASPSQQAVAAQLEKTLSEYRALEQQHRGFSGLTDSDVLRLFVFLLRIAQARTSGRPKSRALIDSLLEQFPERESALVTPDQAGNRIIVP